MPLTGQAKKDYQRSYMHLRQWRKRLNYTKNDYDERLIVQGGVCAACGEPPSTTKRFHLDHNHVTGQIRDLLCYRCNFCLGWFKERPELIKGLLTYLNKWS